jgi:hypothetical protein
MDAPPDRRADPPNAALRDRGRRSEMSRMHYLSDTNIRAILTVLVGRMGGEVTITNQELYDAMLPGGGPAERFAVEETASGVRVWVHDTDNTDNE